jgi:hypothetical protein
VKRRQTPERHVFRSALTEIERLLASPEADRPMTAWSQVTHACRSAEASAGHGNLLEELQLASYVRANGADPWSPPPTLGTLLRLARLNLQAALRKAKEG